MTQRYTFRTTEESRKALVTVLSCGLEFLEGLEDSGEAPSYVLGGVETLAHVAACWICQNEFGGRLSVDTGETRDALRLDKCRNEVPSDATLLKLVNEYIRGIASDVEDEGGIPPGETFWKANVARRAKSNNGGDNSPPMSIRALIVKACDMHEARGKAIELCRHYDLNCPYSPREGWCGYTVTHLALLGVEKSR